MLDYARQRAVQALQIPRRVVLASYGLAGLQAGEFPCRAQELTLYLLLPKTSDHLFNLEHGAPVRLVCGEWELSGDAQLISTQAAPLLFSDVGAAWCVLVQVQPELIQIRRQNGWGYLESLEPAGLR
jgi:hypothetical protein